MQFVYSLLIACTENVLPERRRLESCTGSTYNGDLEEQRDFDKFLHSFSLWTSRFNRNLIWKG